MIRIIDYKAGNAPSVMHAVQKLGFEGGFAKCPDDLQTASHIILPGVGSANATMESLREMDLLQTLSECVLNKKIPFLGICVGLQILFEHSEEEDTVCLGWLKGRVVRFDEKSARVPQMGWNLVSFRKQGLQARDNYFYFVNSYHAIVDNEDDLWGSAEYGGIRFTACVSKENISATQFHIEKSGEAGLSLLNGFLKSRR